MHKIHIVFWLAIGGSLFVPAADRLHANERTIAESERSQSDAVQRQADAKLNAAGGTEHLPSHGDELWILSTRHLPCACCRATNSPDYDIVRVDCESGVPSYENEDYLSLESDPDTVTVVYVHGNRIEPDEVMGRAVQAFQGMRDAVDGGRRVRLVFWSWPSDKVPGQFRDVRSKAARTNCESFYLASFLSERSPHERLNLIGFSFGGRVIAGALHLLAGEEVAGNVLPPEQHLSVKPVNVTLLAPAVNCSAFRTDGIFSAAHTQIENLVIFFNRRDPVLRRFWLFDIRNKPQALGFVGMNPDWSNGPAVAQHDVANQVGRTHREREYFAAPLVIRQLGEQLLRRVSDF